MKVSNNKSGDTKEVRVIYDPSLDHLPIPEAALKKVEKAREFLKNHPIPEHLLRR